MTTILNGQKIADEIKLEIKNKIADQKLTLGLAVILVGDDPASHLYVGLKEKACIEAGIGFEKFVYEATESDENIINKIIELNQSPEINGILVQLPLPNHDTDKIIAAINPLKDVDGFHKSNIEKLKTGEESLAPAVALGIMKLIESTNVNLSNKTASIVSSQLFAEPIEAMLKEQNIKVDVIDPSDSSLSSKTKNSDILIVAAGKPEFITGSIIKLGSIVIDVGTTKVNGKLLGDVEKTSAETIAGFLSPVPGGVGPMTVAMLLENIIKASSLQK
jgi:methylenetetrahydrofolate dehydrogenase (NADP+) / methenyltetrahydrofolate cyclohydrolase